jgi:DNA repair photolyase
MEIRARSILNRSAIGDYCINPYVGCQHACIYCYADYYTRLMGYRGEWGSYVHAKINAPNLLLKEIRKKKKGVVYLSSLTDPYQPVEVNYRLTRRILEILMSYKWPVIIQTKSSSIIRDIDVITKFDNVNVGFTMITLDEDIRRRFEPFSSPINARIDALMRLKEEKVRTFVFIGPILPGTDLDELRELIMTVKDYADLIYFDRLNLKPGVASRIDRALSEIWKPNWLSNLNIYYVNLKKSLIKLLEGERIKYAFVY